MTYHGLHNWPPFWVWTRTDGIKTASGEVGVLKDVYANNATSNKCYLVIQHKNEEYIGCLPFDNRSFYRQITMLLRNHIGHPINEIGNVDL
jgi:hypothetical protein